MNLKATDLANRTGLSSGYISLILSGQRIPNNETLIQIAYILNITDENDIDNLVLITHKDRLVLEETRRRKAEEAMRAYYTQRQPSELNETIDIEYSAKSTFTDSFSFEPITGEKLFLKDCKAIRIQGNSMAPLVYDGQIVFVSNHKEPSNGDLVIVQLTNGASFFKRYYYDKITNMVVLYSVNPISEQILTLKPEQIEKIYKVIGAYYEKV